ncbi:PAAR-like protein [Aquimarina muelleri]|uniref:PAAR-like protein n=1 Tax=Aquimarina muelleri TaxID=279356 RepID=UPI003F687D6E
MNQESQEENDKAEASGVLVCKNATCSCEFGGPPAKLQVTSHQKYYINDPQGAEKLVALDTDNQFLPATFVSCTKDLPYKQCKYAPQPGVKWEGPEHFTECDNKPVILDSYALTCPIYQGKITIQHHGQTQGTTTSQVVQSNPDTCAQLSGLLTEEELAEAARKVYPGISSITIKEGIKKEHGEDKDKSYYLQNKITLGVKNFSKAGYTADKKASTCWVVYQGHSFDTVLSHAKDVGELFEFLPTEPGNYRIEAYGSRSAANWANGVDRDGFTTKKGSTIAYKKVALAAIKTKHVAYTDITVEKNELHDITYTGQKQGHKIIANRVTYKNAINWDTPITLDAKLVYPENPEENTLQTFDWSITDSEGTAVSIAPEDNGKDKLTHTFIIPNNPIETYTITLAYTNDWGDSSTKAIEVTLFLENWVSAIKCSKVVKKIRPNTAMPSFAAKFRLENANETQRSGVNWVLMYYANLKYEDFAKFKKGTVRVTTKEDTLEEGTNTRIVKNVTHAKYKHHNAKIDNLSSYRGESTLTLPASYHTVKGLYVLEAFKNTADGRGLDSYAFEVTDNEIINLKGETTARVKESTTFRVQKCLFSQYIPNTDGDIHWEYKKEGDSTYTTLTTIGQQCTLTFKAKGNYLVRAYIKDAAKCTPFSIKIGEAKVLKSLWVDEDNYAYGNDTASYKITKAGLDQQVYAYAKLQGVANEKVTLQIWEQADKQEVIQTIKEVQVNGKGVLKHPVALDTLKQLQDGNRLAFRIFNAAGKSIHKVSNTYSRKLGIYDDKKLLRAYYTDGSGTILTKFMQYGQQVTLEVVTLNMVGKELEVELYQLIDWSLLDWNGDTKAIAGTKQKIKINSNGKAELQFTIDECWELQYAKEDKGYLEIIPKVNDNFYGGLSVSDTNYIYRLKVSPEAEKLNVEKSPQSCNLVQVEKVAGSSEKKSNNGCPNCDADITMAQIKSLCNVDENGLQEAIDFLNSQRGFFRLTTCTRKAHFLAQLAAESKFTSMEEGFTYNWKSLKKTFDNFSTAYDSNNSKAKEWGYGHDGKTKDEVTETDKRSIANWAYGKAPKASDLGNTAITSNWSNEDADGWKYRGSGFIQLTGKSNFRNVTTKYNTWIARLNEDITEEDFKENPEKLRTNKTLAMAAALIYWKDKNILTRSDMGVGDDALKAVTYRINNAFKGYAHRESYLEEAIKTLKVEDCPDYKRRKGQKGTVVVIGGKPHDMFAFTANRIYARYTTSVYRSMTLEKYKELKENNNLPNPDYVTYLSRDAFDETKKNKKTGKKIRVEHSEKRYGTNNECPPGDKYYLVSKKDSSVENVGAYTMYISDNNNNRDINGPDGLREGIAIHEFTPKDSQGCLTTVTGTDQSKVLELYDEIPDLFLHNSMKKAKMIDDEGEHDMSIERRYVRVILEEREVEIGTWENSANGTNKFIGI